MLAYFLIAILPGVVTIEIIQLCPSEFIIIGHLERKTFLSFKGAMRHYEALQDFS